MPEFKRAIDPATLAAFKQSSFYPCTLVFVDWPGDPVYAFSGTGSMSWNGQTWLGLGEIANISFPEESPSLAPNEMVLGLALPFDQALAAANNKALQHQRVTAWFGATTTPGGAVLEGDPFEAFSGYVSGSPDADAFIYKPGSDYAAFQLRVAAGQPARSSASPVHSHEDQTSVYPNCTGFQRATEAQKWRDRPPQWPQT